MASYVQSTLISGEHIVYEASISKWSLLPAILLGLLTLPLLGAGLACWIWAAVVYYSTELAITNKRVIAKTGLIQRNTIEMFLSKVESVNVEQTVLGRMLDYGTVLISGTGIDKAPFKRISQPLEFRKEFMTAADGVATGGSVQVAPDDTKAQRSEPAVHAADSPATKQTIEERLVELKRLFDSGLITQDVYKEQQRKIIDA